MKLLETLYKVSSPSGMEDKMIRFITGRLRQLNVDYSVDEYGNIYATKGISETYPCVVAHTDEVHDGHKKSFEVITLQNDIIFGYNNVTKQFAGIGADDKNGIWVCLKCLQEFDVLKCAFFVEEERGCIGSGKADMSFFEDCRFVLQCDRRGNNDFITRINGVKICSEEFVRAAGLKEYRYKPSEGMLTDVFTLKRNGLKVSCVNISCGYYEPHTDNEFTVIRDLNNCQALVRHIIADCTEVYPHEYSAPTYHRTYNWGRFGMFDDDFDCPGSSIGYAASSKVAPASYWDYSRQYEELVNLLTDEFPTVGGYTADELWAKQEEFPALRRVDFLNAYMEVMGCAPINS